MYTVYVLRSLKDNKQYVGYTSNFKRRFAEHNAGRTESTKRRRPFIVIHTEQYGTQAEAKDREEYLKTGKGREELKRILSGAVPHPPSAGKSGKGEIVGCTQYTYCGVTKTTSSRRRTQVVRERSAKPLCGGSNPPGASKMKIEH